MATLSVAAPLRVTTSAEYFDEHPTSLELWSPGSPLFPEIGAGSDAARSAPPISLETLLHAR